MINTMNQSKRSDPFSSGEGGERLSLLELNALVRRSMEQCLPDEYWIQAELSDVRSNTTGHCYLEFVQKIQTADAEEMKKTLRRTHADVCG